MNNKDSAKRSGVGFLGLLTLAFIVLKLTNFIDWSWWWVLAPFWIPVVLMLLLFAAVGLYAIVEKKV